MTILRSFFVVTGVLLLLMGCQSSAQSDSSVTLVIPTPLSGIGSPTPPQNNAVLPPVVTVEGEDGGEADGMDADLTNARFVPPVVLADGGQHFLDRARDQ